MSPNTNPSVVPHQKLSLKEKNKEWREATVNSYISKYYFGGNNRIQRKEEMKIAYDLYNGVFNEKDLKYVTDPYKVEDSFPAALQNMNVIKPKIDLLLGEQSGMPDSMIVAQTNEEATTRLQEKYNELLKKATMELVSQGGPNDPVTDKDLDYLEQIGTYMTRDFSDTGEQLAYHILNYLKEKENIKEKFFKGFQDLLIASMAVFYNGQSNGEPIFERVNPLQFSFDYSPEVEYIEDGEWACRRMRMTPSAIYDRFYDLMDERQLDELLSRFNSGSSERGANNEFKALYWRNIPTTDFNDSDNFTSNTIDVWHVVWKSFKKVGFITYTDDDGEVQQDVVDETYKPSANEEIYWDWVTEVWEGYRIGHDLFIGIQPIAEQSISIDNPNSNKLPYSGIVYNNNNTAPKSLVEIMKPLQYMYIVVWYRLETALARDKGKVLNVDITQIPVSMGVDTNKWLHYLSSAGVNFINPYEDGWDIPGREGGKPSAFNQFSSQDLTMSNVIIEYINLMNKIEEMIGELSGVSRQRQGQVQTSELVGNVQQTIIQSSHITKGLFFAYSQVKKRALNNLLNSAKNIYKNSGKKKLHYFTDDMTRVFMDITDDFLFSDFDIFITDSTKENQDLEMLRQLYQPAMQNGASLLDIAEIASSTNMTDIKTKLDRIEKQRKQQEMQMVEAQQQAQTEAAAIQSQMQQAQMQLELEKLRVDEADSIRRAETAIQVALINASKTNEVKDTSVPDLDIKKFDEESKLKRDQLNEQIRHNKATESISKIKSNSSTK